MDKLAKNKAMLVIGLFVALSLFSGLCFFIGFGMHNLVDRF